MKVFVGTLHHGNYIINVETENESLAITTAKWHIQYSEHIRKDEITSVKVINREV